MISFKYGITGNYYCIADNPEKLKGICYLINKSTRSIYYNHKYKCYAIRIKSKKHKSKVKEYINHV